MFAIVHTDFVDGHNVGMLQCRRGGCLNPKAPNVLCIGMGIEEEHLDRHDSIEADLAGFVDYAHAAAGDFLQQFVITEIARQHRSSASLRASPLSVFLCLQRPIERAMRAKRFRRSRREFGSALRTMACLRHTTVTRDSCNPGLESRLQPVKTALCEDLEMS